MKQLYYGKATRRFKIRRCMQFYLEKVKVTAKTAVYPLLTLTFPRLAFEEDTQTIRSGGKTQLTVFPSLSNGRNMLESHLDYEMLVGRAQALAEKLAHLWSNVGCVVMLQADKKLGTISITRTNVPLLAEFYTSQKSTLPKELDRDTLNKFYHHEYKVIQSLKRSLSYAFNKIERESSELVQEFLKEIKNTIVGKALIHQIEPEPHICGYRLAEMVEEKLEDLHRDAMLKVTRNVKKSSKAKPKKSHGGVAAVQVGTGGAGLARGKGGAAGVAAPGGAGAGVGLARGGAAKAASLGLSASVGAVAIGRPKVQGKKNKNKKKNKQKGGIAFAF